MLHTGRSTFRHRHQRPYRRPYAVPTRRWWRGSGQSLRRQGHRPLHPPCRLTFALGGHVPVVLQRVLHISGDDLFPPMYSTNRPAPSWVSPPHLAHAKRSIAVSFSRWSQELHQSSLRIPKSSGMSTLSFVDNPRAVILSRCTRRAVRRRDGFDGSLVISEQPRREGTLDDRTAHARALRLQLKKLSTTPISNAGVSNQYWQNHTDTNHVGTTKHSTTDGRRRKGKGI